MIIIMLKLQVPIWQFGRLESSPLLVGSIKKYHTTNKSHSKNRIVHEMNDNVFVQSVEENEKWSIPMVPRRKMMMSVIDVVVHERVN